jgi:hypothetical protein
MKEYCENPLCENSSVKEVPVSVRKPGDQKRALCSACEEAYSWGAQHGKMSIQKMKVWVLAIADKGLIVHAKAFNGKKEAEKALAEYLRSYENYTGPDDIFKVCDWLAEHDERLSADICSTSVDPT